MVRVERDMYSALQCQWVHSVIEMNGENGERYVTYSADGAVHMVLKGEHVPALILQTWFQFLDVETFENVWFLKLGVGGSDGGLQGASEVVEIERDSWF